MENKDAVEPSCGVHYPKYAFLLFFLSVFFQFTAIS